MALFGKKTAKQAEPPAAPAPALSFEGQQQLLAVEYQQDREDILRGLALLDSQKSRKSELASMLLLVIMAVYAVYSLYQNDPLLAAAIGAAAVAALLLQWFRPALTRKHTARRYAAEKKQGRLLFYATGVRVEQEGQVGALPYRAMTAYEDREYILLLVGNNRLLALRKSALERNLPLLKQLLEVQLGKGRRYFELDDRGKIQA